MTHKFYDKVKNHLDKLEIGHHISIDSIPSNKQEDFISAVKMYIDDNNPGVEFSNDYKRVKRATYFRF